MNRCTFLIVLSLLALIPCRAWAATPEQVEAAMKKARAYLLSQENLTSNAEFEHFWEFPYNHQPEQGGATALVVYSLLAAGEDPKGPGMVRAIDYLKGVDMQGIYAISLRMQVWRYLPLKEVQNFVKRDAETLVQAAHPVADFPEPSFYHYTRRNPDAKEPNLGYDHSNSQFGVLGLWAADDIGIELPTQLWASIDKGWRKHQVEDGGWRYTNNPGKEGKLDEPRATMTIAGIATLYITDQMVHANDGIECKGNLSDPNIDKGIAWIEKNFAKGIPWQYAYMTYGVERIGVASGRKYIANEDWYKEGADYLVRTQRADGALCGGGTIDTAFALLFLAKGRAPVALQKLEYSFAPGAGAAKPLPANWNQRPRDAANFVKWAGKQNEAELNWEIVDLKPSADELHDAPLLLIDGNQTLNLSPADVAKLKQFIEQGGIVVGNADCGNALFVQSFKKLGTSMFGYEFAPLPKSHVLYTEQFAPDKWKNKPQCEALSNGARILMVLLPTDPARYWQTQTRGGHEEQWELMEDLFLYSVDRKSLRTKGDTYIVTADPSIKPTRSMKIARLQYPGSWDPEPGGWMRLANLMHNQDHADLQVTPIELGQGKLTKAFPIAHLTGAFAFNLPADGKAELKKYIDDGGLLVIDAAGGAGEFRASAEALLKEMFPDDKLTSLPVSSPIFAAPDAVKEVAFRRFAHISGHHPLLQGIEHNGRLSVIYSPEDLSVGLVGMDIDGITGYTPASATQLMRDIVTYANNPTNPATAPATSTTKP